MRLNDTDNLEPGECGTPTATLERPRRSRRTQSATSVADSSAQAAVMISAKQLSVRWACSVSSCHRITREAGITRYVLGTGKATAMVRFRLSEVEAYESSRRA